MSPVSVVPPGSQVPPSAPGPRPAAQQQPRSQTLADLLNQLSSISSGSNYQAAEEILNETAGLRNQLQSKEKEVEQVRNEMSQQMMAKQIAIKEMFEANETEKSKHKKATSNIESLQQQLQEGKDALSHKERRIQDAESQYQKLQSAQAQLQTDMKTAHDDIDGLQQKVKDKDALIDRIKTSHSVNLKRLKAVEERTKAVEREKSALDTSLQLAKARLDQIEGYATPHSDFDDDLMADAFVDLWQYATTEMHSHLHHDLSEEILRNRSIWDTFQRQSNLAVEHRVPLPRSNSSSAKQMRLAIMLAILAREVDQHIFQPTYILPYDAGIREVLADLAASDHEQESFCRSILLSINPDAQEAALQSRMETVIRNVSSYVYELLPDDQFSQLRAGVGKIVERSVAVWRPIQRARPRFEPDFEPLQWGDDQETAFEFPEASTAGSESGASVPDESLLTVFPRIAVVEKGHRFPLTYVVQLRTSQPPCMAARREVSHVPTSPVLGRVAFNRSRRKSNASSHIRPANGIAQGQKNSPSV